ncbi:MAG: DUF695 domain-containing protein, partial [Pyrinomonadaceae bacterium]
MGIFNFLKGSKRDINEESLHEENWTAYLSTIEDSHVGSIMVDMGLRDLAPIAGLGQLLIIEIPMCNAREDGLPADGEFETLSDIEESFHLNLTSSIRCAFAGHLYCESTASLYFYVGSDIDLEELLRKSIQSFSDYTFNHRLKPDPEWEAYFDFLYPSPIQMQRIGNDTVIQSLLKHGDNLESERRPPSHPRRGAEFCIPWRVEASGLLHR